MPLGAGDSHGAAPFFDWQRLCRGTSCGSFRALMLRCCAAGPCAAEVGFGLHFLLRGSVIWIVCVRASVYAYGAGVRSLEDPGAHLRRIRGCAPGFRRLRQRASRDPTRKSQVWRHRVAPCDERSQRGHRHRRHSPPRLAARRHVVHRLCTRERQSSGPQTTLLRQSTFGRLPQEG